MLRVTRHCILLLLLASCGGFILQSSIGKGPSDLVEIVESPSLKDIRLQPVPIHDLKRQLQNSKNYYDFFRIFLTKKDVSDDVIDDFVNARTIQKIARDYQDELMMDEEEQARLDEELTDAMYHNEEMVTSPLGECKTPQPEIVRVIDEENKNRLYLPECTVVHRCRNVSGCCGSSNLECGPLKLQVITRSFMVIHLFEEKGLPGEDMVERKVFINHTECGCQERRRPLPNCDDFKCPFPFTMMRHNVECTCDCLKFTNEHNYLCQDIKDGIIPLTETDLACIKSGRCLKPTCTRGELHVQTGHCPNFDEIYLSELELARTRIIKPPGFRKRELSIGQRELDQEEEEDYDEDYDEEEDRDEESDFVEIENVAKARGKEAKHEEPLLKPDEELLMELQVDHPVETKPPAVSDITTRRLQTKPTKQSQTETGSPPGLKPEVSTQMSRSLQSDSAVIPSAVKLGANVHSKTITGAKGNTNKISKIIRDSSIRGKTDNNIKKDRTRRHHRKGRRFHKRQKHHVRNMQS